MAGDETEDGEAEHRPWQHPNAPPSIAAGGPSRPRRRRPMYGSPDAVATRATVWVAVDESEADAVFDLLEAEGFEVELEIVSEAHAMTGVVSTFQVTVRVGEDRRAVQAIEASDLPLRGLRNEDRWDEEWDAEVEPDPDEPWPGYWTLRRDIEREMPLASRREKDRAFARARAEVDPAYGHRRELVRELRGYVVVAVVVLVLLLVVVS